MISSLSIVFLATCYLYFKQYYTKVFDARFGQDDEQKNIWKGKLTKKLKIIPFAIALIVILYLISSIVSKVSPTLENVKLVRRFADVGTVIICVGLFFLDKKELDEIAK